jgi:hypothetical protein
MFGYWAVPQLGRLPIAAVRIRFKVSSCGIFNEQSGTEACLLRVHRFPLPILISLGSWFIGWSVLALE